MTVHIIYSHYLSPDGEKMTVGGIQTYIRQLTDVILKMGCQVAVYQNAEIPFVKEADGVTIYGIVCKEKEKRHKAYLEECMRHFAPQSDILIWASELLVTPVDPSGDKLYYIDFKTSQEGWTVQDVTLPEGFTHVWNVDTKYGYVATTYNKTDKKDCDGEGLIISPKIDLSKATAAKLTVSNSGSYFESDAKMKEQIGVLISTDGTNWTPLEITTWPVYNKFTWVNSTFDLAAYAGKADVQIAFKYIGTATKAGTWEIGTVTIE